MRLISYRRHRFVEPVSGNDVLRKHIRTPSSPAEPHQSIIEDPNEQNQQWHLEEHAENQLLPVR